MTKTSARNTYLIASIGALAWAYLSFAVGSPASAGTFAMFSLTFLVFRRLT